jgi:release factor glutamine methyltransferase
MTTVAQALGAARAAGVDRLDAQRLLSQALERPREWLLAHEDAALDAARAARFHAALARRATGEPLAYLLGEREFHGLALQVDARVLVPRPETELLVDWALELLATISPRRPARPTVADLGTGSGAIALAIKHRFAGADVTATDADAAALGVAAANARRLGLEVRIAHGSWWQAVAGQCFDLAASNPPYVAEADPHLGALRHEPQAALVAGPDGLDALRRRRCGATWPAIHAAPVPDATPECGVRPTPRGPGRKIHESSPPPRDGRAHHCGTHRRCAAVARPATELPWRPR